MKMPYLSVMLLAIVHCAAMGVPEMPPNGFEQNYPHVIVVCYIL